MVKEKDFLSEVTASIPWVSTFVGSPVEWTKIPDSIAGPNSRFSAPKAYDGFLVHEGRHVAVEAKMTHGMSVSFSALNDAQEGKLKAVVDAGGRAFVLVNFRTTFSKAEAKRRGQEKTISAYAVAIEQWLRARRELCAGSIPLHWLENWAMQIPKIRLDDGGIGWDIGRMVQNRYSVCGDFYEALPR